MEPKVSYVVVGVFVIVLGFALVAVALWFAFGWHPEAYVDYRAYFEESVSGLTNDSPVKYHGVPVGHVAHLELDPSDPQKVRVLLAIRRGTPIKDDTVAIVESEGLLGTAYINMDGGSPSSPPLLPKPGEPIPVIPTRPSLLARIEKSAAALLGRMETVGGGVESVLSPENQAALTDILHNVDMISRTLARRRPQIGSAVVSASKAMGRLSRVSKTMDREMPSLLVDLRRTTRALETTADEFSRTGATASAVLGRSAPYLETFAREGLGRVGPLVVQLRELAATLERIAHRIEQDPAALIAGATKGPGE